MPQTYLQCPGSLRESLAKKLGHRDEVRNIPGGPSPKRAAQDDSLKRFAREKTNELPGPRPPQLC